MVRTLRLRLSAFWQPKLLCVGIALTVPACGATSSESLVGPGGPKCSVSLTGPSDPIAASGGPGAVTVNTTPECEWTASAEVGWVTEVTPTQGQGGGQVQFQAVPNPNGTMREGAININGQRAMIRQSAATCALSVAVTTSEFAAAGGTGTLTIAGPPGCAWTAASDAGWIAVAQSAGAGPANVNFTVSPNNQVARTGTITAAGVAVTINQASPSSTPSPPPPSCAIALQPTSRSIAATATTGISVAVSAAAGCAWSVTNNAPSWLTITSGANGNGNGTVTMNAAANTGIARIGTVTIGGQTFTVNQAAGASPCVYSINPTSQSVPATGATGLSVNVSTSGGCAWTATSNATWLTITSGASGSGNGTVRLNVAANTGVARPGTVTIAGQTFTVNQAGAAPSCTYSINPTAVTVGDDNVSNLTVAVTAASGCSWNATSNVSWLDIDSGNSGSGNGTVTYDVDNFGGTSRTGTMTIAGQTFTVTQVRCSTTLNPTTQAVSALGGSFSVSVTTQTGCDWQAVESLSWVSINSGGSGVGGGTVSYTVAPNVAGSRSGTIAIGGTTLTINQSAVIP